MSEVEPTIPPLSAALIEQKVRCGPAGCRCVRRLSQKPHYRKCSRLSDRSTARSVSIHH